MARNGSGVYAPPAADYPAVASTLIESTKFNNVIDDISTALSGSIAANGETTVTQNLPMNSKKFTGLANGSARTDSVALGQVQDGTFNWVDGGGTVDAITATYSPVITALVDGQICCVRATGANTITNPTFSPNGLTARTIYKLGGQALEVGSIRADQHELILRYDLGNTRWELLNPAYADLAGSASQAFSVAAATSAAHALRLDQQQTPFRNAAINGDMAVSQVNGGTAVTPTASGYISDQWRAAIGAASKLTFQQVADAPAGFKYSTKITVAAQYAPAAADSFLLQQPIEGQNIIYLGFGTANNRRIALGLQIKGSIAGTYAVNLFNAAVNRSYVGTIAVTNAWSPVVVTLDADSAGAWVTDNTVALWVSIDLGSGANFNTAAGAWQAGNYYRTAGCVTFVNQANGSTLNVTGVQLEKIAAGSNVGTEFEFVSYAESLRRCQRYLEYGQFNLGIGDATNVNVHPINAAFQCTKRAVPTVICSSSITLNPPATATGINSGALTSVTLPGVTTTGLGPGTGVCAGSSAGYHYYGYFSANAQM